jgi:hypothetical protein
MEEAFKVLMTIFTKSEIETALEESTEEWSDNLKVLVALLEFHKRKERKDDTFHFCLGCHKMIPGTAISVPLLQLNSHKYGDTKYGDMEVYFCCICFQTLKTSDAPQTPWVQLRRSNISGKQLRELFRHSLEMEN